MSIKIENMCEHKDVNFLVKNQYFEVEITKKFSLADHKSLYHNNETKQTITHL